MMVETLHAEKSFELEVSGPSDAATALVLVHGFGGTREERGLFTDIENQFSKSMLVLRGDFSEVEGNKIKALPFSTQVRRLHAISAFAQETFHPEHTVYLGFSQGSIVIAAAAPQYSKIVLLAPPIISPFREFIKTPGWSRLGSLLDIEGTSRLMRSDCFVEVEKNFWKEFEKVNAVVLYTEFAKHNEVEIIFAGADQVLGQQEAPENIKSTSVSGADHHFSETTRTALLKMLPF